MIAIKLAMEMKALLHPLRCAVRGHEKWGYITLTCNVNIYSRVAIDVAIFVEHHLAEWTSKEN